MDHTRLRRSHGVCTQCRRQKQKCDRQTPCSNCSRRRIPHLCHGAVEAGRASLSTIVAASPRPSDVSSRTPDRPTSTPTSNTATATATVTARPRVGHIWNSRGAPSYHSESYFGPQAVAGMMLPNMPDMPEVGVHLTSVAYRRSASSSHHGALSLHAHIWELLGHVPRPRAVADAMIGRFFAELNEVFDGLHQETFLSHYEAFWSRRWGDDDLLTVDLRWLALFFMVLAFSELLLGRRPGDSAQALLEHEETSLQFFWASRKCLVIAPTFSGESADLVRAGILISRYLIFSGRKAEAWLTNSFAVRMAQAQGMHVDGEHWRLPQEVSETRRRLWATLYTLDRTLALALGRPYVIHDKHCMHGQVAGGSSEDREPFASSSGSACRPDYISLQQSLSTILGHIQDECFGLQAPTSTAYHAYENVLRLDGLLVSWADALPPVFRLHHADTSTDVCQPALYWQRVYLHALFHFARITLHRTYVVLDLDSVTDRFRFSRDVCVASACADLQLKLSFRSDLSMADRLKASVASHNLFNSALVLGIVTVREPLAPATGPILEDLQAYCEKLAADTWSNDFVLAEVKVIELCIASARKARREALAEPAVEPTAPPPPAPPEPTALPSTAAAEQAQAIPSSSRDMYDNEHWIDNWLGPTGSFPEPVDFRLWEDLVGNLENRQ